MPPRQHSLLIPATIVGLLLLVGCSGGPQADYSSLDLIDVTGCVTLDGIVLEGARIEFENPDTTCSSGTTDARGRYRLMFDSQTSGCLPGEKTVRIRMVPAEADVEDPDAVVNSGIFIPPRYNTDSELRAVVSSGKRTFDFDLTTAEEDETAP